jgi:hypothetical protein
LGPTWDASRSLKGKTVRRSNKHVAAGINAVPAEVIKLHQHVTLTIDIMFVNKVPLFVTKLLGLQFTMIEALPNQQVWTVKDLLKEGPPSLQLSGVYCCFHICPSRGSLSTFARGIPPSTPLQFMSIMSPTLSIERHIVRTIKDSTRSTYCMLPFWYIPRIVLIHLVKNGVFWLNAAQANDGIAH